MDVLASEEALQRNLSKLRNELGPVICKALDDSSVVEIMVNPDGYIWLDRMSMGIVNTDEKIAPERLLAGLGTIAAMLRTEVNKNNPIIEGELPLDGSRVEGIIPPVVRAPSISIRKHSSSVIPMDNYINEGRISAEAWEYLKNAILSRRNIVIVGGTGSGKTTFVNAVLDSLAKLRPDDRVLILEDTAELQCNVKDLLSMRTDARSGTTMQKLVKACLRLRPDRIIVGEVRGGEALDLLKSWNTGHPGGICTVHANGAKSALIRLEQLISEVSQTPMRDLIGEAVDVVVFLQRVAKRGPMVEEILLVKGVENGEYICEMVYKRDRETDRSANA